MTGDRDRLALHDLIEEACEVSLGFVGADVSHRCQTSRRLVVSLAADREHHRDVQIPMGKNGSLNWSGRRESNSRSLKGNRRDAVVGDGWRTFWRLGAFRERCSTAANEGIRAMDATFSWLGLVFVRNRLYYTSVVDGELLDIDLLDGDDPFEIDDQAAHLIKHAPFGIDDVYDVWESDPLFNPAVRWHVG